VRSEGHDLRLDDVRGFVFDIDGTLVHRAGERIHVQPGARDALERIRASGRPFVLFTNGSHAPPETFAAGLRAAGLPVGDEQVLTPLCSAQVYLHARHRDGSVLMFSSDAAREYIARAGVRVLDGEDAERADAVFVAHTDVADFAELERAARAVLAGARLLTGSYAPAYAGANGPIFSRGAMLTAAIAKVTGARPVIVGKPSRAAVQTIGERLGMPTSQLAVIGDDLGMDIALGRIGGSRTVLVRSGISAEIALERLPESRRPDAVVGGVADLLERL
jgi:NagD protein